MMNKKRRIAFIVEGKKAEPIIISNMIKNFFMDHHFPKVYEELISLPVGFSIYQFWLKFKDKDMEELNVLDILKEEVFDEEMLEKSSQWTEDYFSEIYLIFDHDAHVPIKKRYQRDLIISELLDKFDNETENGKLILSYPMVEAINELSFKDSCQFEKRCLCDAEIGKLFKNVSMEYCRVKEFAFEEFHWVNLLNNHIQKMNCLFEREVDYSFYKNTITPKSVYQKQKDKYINDINKVMIISAFPEFIIDYFDESFWNTKISIKKGIWKCQKQLMNV